MHGTGSSVHGVGAKDAKPSHAGLGIMCFFFLRAIPPRLQHVTDPLC